MPSAVSFRYATALADTLAGAAAGKPAPHADTIAAQLREFNELCDQNHELRIVFSTPAVSLGQKKSILGKLAADLHLDSVTANFISVVIDHERMGLLGEIIEAFQHILHEREGAGVAEVTSARALDEDEKRELGEALNAKTGKQIRLSFSVDPNLVGGVVARIGGVIYDGSVQGFLSRLRTELTGT